MADQAYTTNETIAITLGTIFSGVALGVAAWIKRRFVCQDIVASRSLRTSHALILIAQRLDEITERLHPDEKSNLAEQIESALKDEFGNL